MSHKEEFLAQYGDSQAISNGLDNKDMQVRKSAIKNYGASSDHIDKALNDSVWGIRKIAISHKNANNHHIDKASVDPSIYVRDTAIKKCSDHKLKEFIDTHPNPEVRELAKKQLNSNDRDDELLKSIGN